MHVARKIHSRPPLRKYIRGHNLAGITRVVRAGTTVIYPVEMEKKTKTKESRSQNSTFARPDVARRSAAPRRADRSKDTGRCSGHVDR